MTKLKNLLFIALLVFLFVEVLIIFPSQLEKRQESESPSPSPVAEAPGSGKTDQETPSAATEQKMQGVHLVESQQGNRDWELFAVSAEGNQGQGNWVVRRVKVLFYSSEKVEFTVTGDKGSIDYKTKDIEIAGNVVTRSENGYVFKTSEISYSSRTRQIRSPRQVTMQGPRDKEGAGMYLKGGRMVAFVDDSRMKIEGGVSARKPGDEGKFFDVSADGAEFSGKSREAKFLGAVRIAYDDMKLEGPEASFIYKAGQDILSAVNIKGGVRVRDSEKFATAETVNLDLLADKYVFKGQPKVIQNSDELSGEEIIFLDGGKKVRVERVRAKVEKQDE